VLIGVEINISVHYSAFGAPRSCSLALAYHRFYLVRSQMSDKIIHDFVCVLISHGSEIIPKDKVVHMTFVRIEAVVLVHRITRPPGRRFFRF
jgi:hypothetical protein